MSNVVNAAMSRRVDYFEGTIIEAVSGNGAETMKLPVASNTVRRRTVQRSFTSTRY
jgi:hypothetical protein